MHKLSTMKTIMYIRNAVFYHIYILNKLIKPFGMNLNNEFKLKLFALFLDYQLARTLKEGHINSTPQEERPVHAKIQ